MCGIVGIFGKLTTARIDAFEEMLLMDVVRGTDSVGVAAITSDGYANVVKDIVWPEDLMSDASYKELVKDHTSICGLLGHNRAATRGKATVKNAHPFQHGDITMVHNGTFFTYKFANTTFDTDSEIICHDISVNGIEKAWPKMDGAATLVWWDSTEKKLFAISNGKRPFFFIYLEKFDAVVFASEEWMIHSVCKKFSIAEMDVDVMHYFLEDDKLYSFQYVDGVVKLEGKKIEGYKNTYTAAVPTDGYPGTLNGVQGRWKNGQFIPNNSVSPRHPMYSEIWDDYGLDGDYCGVEREHHESCSCEECKKKWADGGAEIIEPDKYHPSMPDPNIMAIKCVGHDEGCLCQECANLRIESNIIDRTTFKHHQNCDCNDCKVALMHPVWCDCAKCKNLSAATQEKRQSMRSGHRHSLVERRAEQFNNTRHQLLRINVFRKTISEAAWNEEYRNCAGCGCSLVGEYDQKSMIICSDNKQALCSDCVKTGLDAGMSTSQLSTMVH